MEVSVKNFVGDSVGSYCLNPAVFSLKWKPVVINEVVKWQLAKRRSGNHKTKEIGDISGTTAKPHQQKRTGRARQGSLRSPQFRGGAVIFGPVVRSHAYSLNKKVRSLGLKMALSLKFSAGDLVVLDNISSINSARTADFSRCIGSFLEPGGKLLLVGDYSVEAARACGNLVNVNLMRPEGVNVLDLLKCGKVGMTVDSVRYLEERLS